MSDAIVNRLHQALVRALDERGTDALERTVTVAEIYQDLVPYRAVRTSIGVELNADYEHALLRLLAGVDGRVRLEPPSARDELRRELGSPNPNVGLYRKFAACDVRVLRAAEGSTADGNDAVRAPGPSPDRGATAAPGASPGPAAPATPTLASVAAAAPAERGARGVPAPPSGTGSAPACAFCGERLPATRSARFCPFCGMDQSKRPCASCGAVLEPDWRFCIDCGRPAESARSPVPAGGPHA